MITSAQSDLLWAQLIKVSASHNLMIAMKMKARELGDVSSQVFNPSTIIHVTALSIILAKLLNTITNPTGRHNVVL